MKADVGMNYREIAEVALNCIDQVLSHWLPGGVQKVGEYVARNPKRSDGKPGSFKIDTITGMWSDSATGDSGSDLISLIAYMDGVSQSEVMHP